MVRVDKWVRGTLAAWKMLIDFPLPSGLEEYRRRGCDQFSRLIGFPLLGLAIGVVLVLVAAFCSAVFNRIAGGIIFALLATAFLDLKDSGRGVGLLLSLLLLKFRRVPFRESLGALNPELVQTDSPQLTVLLAVFELLKALFFFLLCFYGAKLWLVVILVGAFTVQGTLAMLPDSESGKPFLAISEENHKKIGIAAAVIYVLLMLAFPVGIIAAGAAVYFIATGFRRYFLHEFGGVTANWITLAGAITESVLLLVGILLALHVGH